MLVLQEPRRRSSHDGHRAGELSAQGLTGQISGTVTDSGGGVLPGVTVTIRNVGTGRRATP